MKSTSEATAVMAVDAILHNARLELMQIDTSYGPADGMNAEAMADLLSVILETICDLSRWAQYLHDEQEEQGE